MCLCVYGGLPLSTGGLWKLESRDSPGAGVTCSCEAPTWMLGTEVGTLTTEPPLQHDINQIFSFLLQIFRFLSAQEGNPSPHSGSPCLPLLPHQGGSSLCPPQSSHSCLELGPFLMLCVSGCLEFLPALFTCGSLFLFLTPAKHGHLKEAFPGHKI